MSSIDLDPFSSAGANAAVQAADYFYPNRSALTRPWRSPKQKSQYPNGVNVWMNPPYSQPIIGQAIEKLLKVAADGQVAQAIVLVNNATETEWFHQLVESSSALCFHRRRIGFYTRDGKAISGNTRGQVVFYLPFRHDVTPKFLQEFCVVGFPIVLNQEDKCKIL